MQLGLQCGGSRGLKSSPVAPEERPVTWWGLGSAGGPPRGGAIGVILGVFRQEHTMRRTHR